MADSNLTSRRELWTPIFKGWWLVISIILLLWGIFGNIRGEFISAEEQDKWRLPSLFPKVRWYWLVIIFLVLTIVAILEGIYRAHRRKVYDLDTQHKAEFIKLKRKTIRRRKRINRKFMAERATLGQYAKDLTEANAARGDLEAENLSLESIKHGLEFDMGLLERRYRPRVEILFEDKPDFVEFQHLRLRRGYADTAYFRICRIGIRSIGGGDAHDLQVVFSCQCQERLLNNIPLRSRYNTTPPFNPYFSLSSNPDQIEYINVVMRQEPRPPTDAKRPDEYYPIRVCYAVNDENIDARLCTVETHEVTITVYGPNSESCSKKFHVFINEHDQLRMELSEGQSVQNSGSMPSS